MSIAIVTYKDRDNVTGLRLSVNGKTVNASNLTKIEFVSNNLTVSTENSPDIFDTTDTEIHAKFGLSSFPVGRHLIRVIGYDPTNEDGIVFGEFILTIIKRI